MYTNRRFRPRNVVGIFAKIIVGFLAFSVVVMLLWNALMPEIFHLPVIDFWQALGLLVLSKILLTGFRGGPGGGWRRDALREKWGNMSPEQREQFRQEWGRRCGRPGDRSGQEPAGAPTARPDPGL
ncbi:MAG TPA: hypothetical protein VN616_09780 [Puia sp.]|nr:hypothetical protein [Puia sp.]